MTWRHGAHMLRGQPLPKHGAPMSEHDDNDEDFAEATLIQAIENQLESGEPAAAKAVYNKLTPVSYTHL